MYAFFDDLDMMAREMPAQLRFVMDAERQAQVIEVSSTGNRRLGPACLRRCDIYQVDQR